MAQRTLTNGSTRDPRRGPSRIAPCVIRLLDYERPLSAGSRHDLEDAEQVEIGRNDPSSIQRRGTQLTLQFDDARMSGRHARLVREATGWVIEDAGSRNGTLLEGAKIERAPLVEGWGFGLGRTAFGFRMAERASRSDVTADELVEALPGTATFSTPFGARLTAANRLARSPQSLVLHGETGTGKEVVARGIHTASRRTGAFVAVNCGALPPTLVESELFGFRKGAFSGATEDRPGLIRSADAGTLFLDEIGDLPPAVQASLLRVLQEREVLPIGAARPVAVDVRVIAASHKDLEHEVAAGRFREDLLARLNGYTVEIPSLRERREDLGILIAALLSRVAPGRKLRFAPAAGWAMVRYDWPRNVRELEQVLATAAALADDVIEVNHLSAAVQRGNVRPPVEDLAPSETRQRDELIGLLTAHKGNIAAVGRAMGVARMQVHRWLERYGLSIDAFRK